jgi:transcriptional regulator with XRE-family HTH domain
MEFARRHKGWNQRQLADLVRIHQYFISELERGLAVGEPDQRERLAKALDVDVDTLLQPVASAVLEQEQAG